jgi:tRNA A-37 threonylcarbamoyl transferase component Bud32
MSLRCAEADAPLVRAVLAGAHPSETVKENSARIVRRVAAPGGALYLKFFRDRGPLAAIRRLVADRSSREFEALDHLRKSGVSAAEPVACGVHEGRSFVLTREVAGARILKDLAPSLDRAGRSAMVRELGRFVRSVHDAGVRDDDLHLGNILVTGEAAAPRLTLIDVHRASLGAVDRSQRVRGLGFLLLAMRTYFSRADQRRFLRAYWGTDLSKSLLLDLRRAFRDAFARHAESRTARCLKSGREFERRDGFCLRRPLTAEEARRLMEATPVREVKRVGRRRLWLAAPDRFVREDPRAGRIWRNAHALAVRGVATPRLWAWSGDRLVGEWFPDAEPLSEYVASRFAGAPPSARRDFARRLARFVRGMHGSGAWHRDLKANNILVREGPGGAPEFLVVDVERARFAVEIAEEGRLADLAQLNAALGAPVTIGDRLAFYRAYAGSERDWAVGWKERVRRIMEATRARRHRWPARPD